MMRSENRTHANTAEKALRNVYHAADEQAIVDLMSDLRHLCDLQGRDYYKLDRRAYRVYASERGAQ